MRILMPNILMTLMVILHTWVVLQRQNCVLRCFLPRFVAKHREPFITYKGENHESVDTHHYYNKNHLSFKLSWFSMYHEAGLLQIAWFENDPIKEIKLFQEKKILTQI